MTDHNKLNESLDKLWHDFLELGENYQDELPVQEFGFGLIRMATGMLFDCAGNEGLAYRTALAAIEVGYTEHLKRMEEQNETK
jgi:hypothetical protein